MIQQRIKRWTEEENNFVRENYTTLSDYEISVQLNRSEHAIRGHRRKLGLHRTKKKRVVVNKSDHKITFQDVQDLFAEREYILLSDETEYKNQSSKMRYLCPKHIDKGELKIDYGHLKQGRGCYYCGRERTETSRNTKVTSKDDKELCEVKGFEYVRTEKIDGVYTIFFYCPKHKDLGIQSMRRGNMNRDSVNGCQYCIGRNLPNWYIKKEIEDKYPQYNVVSDYIGMSKSLTCYCKKHNATFTHAAKYIFYEGRGCKDCEHERRSSACRLPDEVIVQRVHEANPDIEIISLDNYTTGESHIPLRCKKCGYEWHSPYSSVIVNQTQCPACSWGYKGEQQLIKILSSLNLKFKPQYIIDECKNKRALPFDNSLLDEDDKLICLFEYYGEQHYSPIEYFGGEEKFKDTIYRDGIKQNYCKEHNIPLLIIPYWEYDNMDNLVQDFIKELN